jgi:hypothetical protein
MSNLPLADDTKEDKLNPPTSEDISLHLSITIPFVKLEPTPLPVSTNQTLDALAAQTLEKVTEFGLAVIGINPKLLQL